MFKHVIKHELVHVFMMSKVLNVIRDHRETDMNIPPLWFTEGLAEYLSTEWDAQAEMIMRDAVINGFFFDLTNIYAITGTFLMYKEGQSFLEFVEDTYGYEKVTMILDNYYMYTDFYKLLEYCIGKPLTEINNDWTAYERKRFYPLVEEFSPVSQASEQITKNGFHFDPVYYDNEEKAYYYHIGNTLGYTSLYRTRAVDNIDYNNRPEPELILAGERDAEFESFHILQPSLDISNDGIIAFVTKSGGTDVIHFYDTKTDKKIDTFQRDQLISIIGPSFSDDGKHLVFEAVDTKGFSDLYVLDTDTYRETRLTNDYYQDSEPIFGRTEKEILFVSDRTTGENERHSNIFSFDLETLRISYVTNLPANCASPELSPAKDNLIFTTDYDGVHNIYSLNIEDGSFDNKVTRVSKLLTGASSPRFVDSTHVVFGGFEKFSLHLYKYELPDTTDSLLTIPMEFTNLEGKWLAARETFTPEYEKVQYEEEYTLDYAQSQVSTDAVYGTRGGGVISISDMLSDDKFFFLIYNTAEVQSDFLDSWNIDIFRLKQGQRANYGYGIFHTRGRRYDIRDSDEYYFERSFGGYFTMHFPLSTFSRIETSASLSNSNKEVVHNVIERKALLWSNSIAYVNDNSLWGPTGPMDGRRFRLQLSYTSDVKHSNVNYFSFIFDYRHYQRLSLRTTLAFRASLYYNEGKEARRYFMGGSWDLRGWNRFSIRGEKMWISSLELRLPLIDQIALRLPFMNLGFAGVRTAIFVDAGSAWDTEYRGTLGSVGFGFRFNLFGALVLRYDMGKKIQDDFTRLQEGLFYQFFFGWDF